MCSMYAFRFAVTFEVDFYNRVSLYLIVDISAKVFSFLVKLHAKLNLNSKCYNYVMILYHYFW